MSDNALTVYVGFDPAEEDAFSTAMYSMCRQPSPRPLALPHWAPLHVQGFALNLSRLESRGVMYRPMERENGQLYDVISHAPCSTEFAISRFIVPAIHQGRWAMFVDCDVLFHRSPLDVFDEVRENPGKAVYCVQHDHRPTEDTKMGGLAQTRYDRKNWSSVMLFDCDHPALEALTVRYVNEARGLDLHQFAWIADEHIGELPPAFNWLVDVHEKPDDVAIAHMTLGGPWIPGWQGGSHDDEWLRYARGIV